MKTVEKQVRAFVLYLGIIIIVVMFAPMLLEYMGFGEIVRVQ